MLAYPVVKMTDPKFILKWKKMTFWGAVVLMKQIRKGAHACFKHKPCFFLSSFFSGFLKLCCPIKNLGKLQSILESFSWPNKAEMASLADINVLQHSGSLTMVRFAGSCPE